MDDCKLEVCLNIPAPFLLMNFHYECLSGVAASQLLFLIIHGTVYSVPDNYKAICLPTTIELRRITSTKTSNSSNTEKSHRNDTHNLFIYTRELQQSTLHANSTGHKSAAPGGRKRHTQHRHPG
jgi:hypothetical protein